MIAAVVRWLSLLATGFVILSFLFFAVNQTSNASKNQVDAINGGSGVKAESVTKLPNPPPAVERVREKENSGLHEFIDDVDDVLLAPFTGISNSHLACSNARLATVQSNAGSASLSPGPWRMLPQAAVAASRSVQASPVSRPGSHAWKYEPRRQARFVRAGRR